MPVNGMNKRFNHGELRETRERVIDAQGNRYVIPNAEDILPTSITVLLARPVCVSFWSVTVKSDEKAVAEDGANREETF